jgi:hypothetical protein
MENPAIEKSRKEIQTALRGLSLDSHMPAVDEWRDILRVTGRCKNLQEAIDLLHDCVFASEVGGERIERPKQSGVWISLVLASRQRIKAQNDAAAREQRERDLKRDEESRRRSNDAATLLSRTALAAELVPALESTGDERAKLWAGFARKDPTPFIISNCRRILRALSVASLDAHSCHHSNELTAHPNQATQDQENAATGLQMQTVA